MDDLAFMRERIESYADYTNDDDRRLSDEQVRAYVGEALARLMERLQPSGAASETLSQVLLRCQFADQRVMRALDVDVIGASEIAGLRGADRELATLADRADTIDAGGVLPFVVQIGTALDRRSQIAIAGGTSVGP